MVLRRPAFDTSFLVSALAPNGAAPVLSVHCTTSQLSVLDSSATLYIYGIFRDDSDRLGKTAGSRLSLSLNAIVRPDSAVLKTANQPIPLIANCLAIPEEGQYVVGEF